MVDIDKVKQTVGLDGIFVSPSLVFSWDSLESSFSSAAAVPLFFPCTS